MRSLLLCCVRPCAGRRGRQWRRQEWQWQVCLTHWLLVLMLERRLRWPGHCCGHRRHLHLLLWVPLEILLEQHPFSVWSRLQRPLVVRVVGKSILEYLIWLRSTLRLNISPPRAPSPSPGRLRLMQLPEALLP